MAQNAQLLRSASFWLLCLSLVLIVPLAGARGMRIDGFYQTAGGLLFAAVALSAWLLSRPPTGSVHPHGPRLRVAGMLLLVPFALIALFWVGLGTPWDATPAENKMRYAVLLTGAVAITVATFLLKDLLVESGERLYATLAHALGVLSGLAFVVWTSYQMGFHAMVMDQGQTSSTAKEVNNVLDALLFAAGCLAYLMTATFARSLAKVRWLGRKASWAYISLNLLALAFLVLRGVSFPVPSASPAPWYTRPGFIVGIPAMPWVMPFLLGVVFLRRAGEHPEPTET